MIRARFTGRRTNGDIKNLKLKFSDFTKNLKLTSFISMIAGIIFVLFPEGSGRLLAYVIGGIFGAIALFSLRIYFKSLKNVRGVTVELITAIVSAVICALCFLATSFMLKAVSVILGIWVLFDGLMKIPEGRNMIRNKWPGGWMHFIMGIVTAVLGIAMVVFPLFMRKFMFVFIGVILLVNSAVDTFSAAILKKTAAEEDLFDADVTDVRYDDQ